MSVCVFEIMKSENWSVGYFKFLKFANSVFFNFWNDTFEFRSLGFWEVWSFWKPVNWKGDVLLFGAFLKLLNFEILKSWTVEDGHRKMMKIPVNNLRNHGYAFHIYRKTWNGNLLTFLFASKGIHSTPQHTDPHPIECRCLIIS